jgi:hypothetical protein
MAESAPVAISVYHSGFKEDFAWQGQQKKPARH